MWIAIACGCNKIQPIVVGCGSTEGDLLKAIGLDGDEEMYESDGIVDIVIGDWYTVIPTEAQWSSYTECTADACDRFIIVLDVVEKSINIKRDILDKIQIC